MKKSSRLLVLAAVSSLLFLSGCVASIGNREPARSNATLGQQLIDLQKARDSGVLSESEYQTQRTKFLGEK
jgi:PBP1b-binding outer membrane lipoprotein LpoB